MELKFTNNTKINKFSSFFRQTRLLQKNWRQEIRGINIFFTGPQTIFATEDVGRLCWPSLLLTEVLHNSLNKIKFVSTPTFLIRTLLLSVVNSYEHNVQANISQKKILPVCNIKIFDSYKRFSFNCYATRARTIVWPRICFNYRVKNRIN